MLKIIAPLPGWAAPLEEVPDPVFAGRILGDGVAIDPIDGQLLAPCDGVVSALASHAVTIRAENGAEILIHAGLETVALKGIGFTALTELGRKVKCGEPLIAFDLDLLAARAKSLITPVILVNGERFAIRARTENREVAAGEVLFEIVPLAVVTDEGPASCEAAERRVRIVSEHGLHARPAAILANAAKAFPGEVMLSCDGRSANAKSAVAVMALGVRFDDSVVLTARGAGAEDLLARLAGLLDQPHKESKAAPVAVAVERSSATKVQGVCAAPGLTIGVVVPLHHKEIAVPEAGQGIAFETKSLQTALARLRAGIEAAVASAAGPKREILSAHLELLADPELEAAALRSIEQNKSAAFAWRQAIHHYADIFRGLDDARMRERAADLLDLERQLLTLLLGVAAAEKRVLPPNAILVADEILPSDLAAFESGSLAGLLSARGGPTSHVAILAAAMNIPALVGAGEDVLSIPEGREILLDATAGFADLAPDAQRLAEIRQQLAAEAVRAAQAKAQSAALAYTADGARIEVFANLGKGAEEAASAVALGAEGCGLLRTEFLFMERETPPDESEQRNVYQAIAEALEGRPLVLRSFDIGADKPVSYLSFPPEDNPQLGLRGVRAGLFWPELLRTQLRAALQVAPAGCCRILLPMITGLSELREVRAMVEALCAELVIERPSLGVMIETPASAILADQLAAEADFFSIGTNDLTQYVLAMDRTHGLLSKQLDGLHPAVLRLIAKTAEAANGAGKIAAICGGLAADPKAVPILIGLGIKELSVPAPSIPRLKAQIRSLHIADCQALAGKALLCDSPAAVRALQEA